MDPTENWKRQALAAAQIVALIDAEGDQGEIADLASSRQPAHLATSTASRPLAEVSQ